MPQSLPWFNNNIDPLLPPFSELVEGLYWYNDGQTYDTLEVRGVYGLIGNNLPDNFFANGVIIIQDCYMNFIKITLVV